MPRSSAPSVPKARAERAPRLVVATQSVQEIDAAKAAEAARKAAMGLKPNVQGDWFPGWDGHYPPGFTALER